MIACNFLNHDMFSTWARTGDFWIDKPLFEYMYDWCDENFGPRNVGIVNLSNHKKVCNIRLYFKNESDLSFFMLKYGDIMKDHRFNLSYFYNA